MNIAVLGKADEVRGHLLPTPCFFSHTPFGWMGIMAHDCTWSCIRFVYEMIGKTKVTEHKPIEHVVLR